MNRIIASRLQRSLFQGALAHPMHTRRTELWAFWVPVCLIPVLPGLKRQALLSACPSARDRRSSQEGQRPPGRGGAACPAACSGGRVKGRCVSGWQPPHPPLARLTTCSRLEHWSTTANKERLTPRPPTSALLASMNLSTCWVKARGSRRKGACRAGGGGGSPPRSWPVAQAPRGRRQGPAWPDVPNWQQQLLRCATLCRAV